VFHRGARKEADATVSSVEMLKRNDYGVATVRVVYTIQPLDEPSFEVIREGKVKMAQLPQAGQRVCLSYDPNKHERFEVLTAPGEETGTIVARTVELPYNDPQPGYKYEIASARESGRQQDDPTLEKLKQLGELRDSGVLTDAEFESQKAKVLADS
jgi:hypothetical protein